MFGTISLDLATHATDLSVLKESAFNFKLLSLIKKGKRKEAKKAPFCS